MTDSNTIALNYSDAQLHVLVEEYIVQQRTTFTLQGVCAYITYWAMEESHTTGTGLYESNQLCATDCRRVSNVLQTIVREGRIVANGDNYKKLMN